MSPSRTRAPPRRLVVATGNAGKLAEFRRLLADLPFDVVSQGELGVASVEETGSSFLENALIKARHAAAATGCAALADDSGLEVDALDGAPGIHSARFAGPGADDAANNAKLLRALAPVPAARRTARYRCVLVYLAPVSAAMESTPIVAAAEWEGRILAAPQGDGGFGYDPLFWVPECRATAAGISGVEKDRLSHRGRAMAALRARLAALAAADAEPP
jgi:XTP/dITP diphosphohydrolase